MNNIPNNGENDHTLNDGLKDGLDKLCDAYGQLQHEEPPDMLDQAVLNSAHRAVEKKPGWMQFGWLHGLTTAAVFVLAISLIFHQREQVPVYDDGIRANESANESMGLQRENAAKKQSVDRQSDDLRMEIKEKREERQDVFQGAPASQNRAIEATARDQAAEPATGARISAYASKSMETKTERPDLDAVAGEQAVEELLTDEADITAAAPEAENAFRQTRPAAIAAPVTSEAEAPAERVSAIEQRLQNILELKQTGDETWITELALFKQDYPDYPLPDELSK